MKLEKEMEQVFFNWCLLFDLEQDYKYVSLFFKDALSFYNIPVHNNHIFILDKSTDIKDILIQVSKNSTIMSKVQFVPSGFTRFIYEIDNNLKIKQNDRIY